MENNMEKKRVVVLLSGGMDSATLLYDLVSQRHIVRAIGFDYGQRHKRELKCATLLASNVGVPFNVADLSALAALLPGSSQTDPAVEVPEGHYAADSMKVTVVPNRNMIMLAVAAGHARAFNSDVVAYACHAGDHTIYPDCRPVFVDAMKTALQVCDFEPLALWAPYLGQTKGEIAKRGFVLDVPFEQTWSCYKGGEFHCGRCGTCVERHEAFMEAGIPDPTEYAPC
jgi:7-cyano-7-deazaguanine synthase